MSGDIDKIRMPDSLFSLEVVVEKLIVPSVVCRFPAVAFRLLDFPTLLVYHVQPDLAETIKTKIAADPYFKVPPQLQELKDKSGYFRVKKGKSCLFKVSPPMLQAHLMNTPLYVMLIDTYPKVPKLLGNCAIPIDDVMARISDDINRHGISTPSAHGERGEFKIYNLMGFEIGNITLGYRLLSLGMGLIPHMPVNEVTVFEPTSDGIAIPPKPVKHTKVIENSHDMDNIVDNIIQGIQSADKNTQVAVSEFLPSMEHMNTQTEKEISYFRSSGIQTDKPKKKRLQHSKRDVARSDEFSQVGNEMSDFFVTNMACPPPLFYNSEADDIHVYQHPLQQGMTFTEDGLLGVQTPKPNYAWGDEKGDEVSSYSDDTIRQEDVFSESDIEEDVDFKSKRVVYSESPKAIARKAKSQSRNMTDKRLAEQTAKVVHNMNQPNIKNLQQLPLLNALLKEIMALQGVSSAEPILDCTAVPKSKVAPSQKKVMPEEIEREKYLKKLSTPRNAVKQAVPGSPHRVCSDVPQPVPKSKSWVRKEPDTAVRIPKTKLSYGMTNAQRLRLAKANPDLLKKLEKQDQERIERSREKTRVKYLQYQREAKIGERLMHSARDSTGQRPQRLSLDFEASMESTNGQLSEASKMHRRPVPTPRRSVSMKQEQMKDVLNQMMEKEHGRVTEFPQRGDLEDIEYNDTLSNQHDDYTYENQGAVPEESHEAKGKINGSVMDKVPAFGRTKTLYNPGFSTEAMSNREEAQGRPESRPTDYAQYSEDFENDQENSVNVYSSAEEPSLRKVVDRYSSDSESRESQVLGDEPSLRRVVDQYSSDEQQTDYETAASQDSNRSQSGKIQPGGPAPVTGMMLSIASMPNPRASIHSPVSAIRPQIPLTGEGLAASSTPTESDLGTQQSTAFIRESQIPTMSETGGSYDVDGVEPRQSFDLRPRPSPRRKLDRVSSIHTESVSSYAPSDVDNVDLASEEDGSENYYTESFDEDSASTSSPTPVKQMNELKLAPEARMGYTWGYSR